jgi:hypothetical protein
VQEFDAFVNDTWQLHPRLTLSLGLRWEFATVPFETQGLLLVPEGGEDAVFGISGPEGFYNPGVFDGIPCREPGYGLSDLPMAPTEENIRSFINSCATRLVPGGSNNGLPLWDTDYNNFGPSLSVAWDPFGDGKTSIRAGYRLSYMQDDLAMILNNVEANQGLTVSAYCRFTPLIQPACGKTSTGLPLLRSVVDSNGDIIASQPSVPPPPAFGFPTVPSFLDNTFPEFRTYAKDLGTPYYQEWNLSVSREVLGNTAVELRYVGNRGLGLRRVADFNEFNIHAYDPITDMTFLESFLIARDNLLCNQALTGPWGRNFRDLGNATDPACASFGLAGPNPLIDTLIPSSFSAALSDSLLFGEPAHFLYSFFTQFQPINWPERASPRLPGGTFWVQVLEGRFPANFFLANPFVASARRMENDGFSTYHAIQLELRRRLSRGLTFQANYSFNRALTDFDGESGSDFGALLDDARASSVRNSRYAVRDVMPRHMVKANWMYELPMGPGKPFSSGNAIVRKILEGWQTGGILYWRSGRPISITSGAGAFHRATGFGDNTVDLTQHMSDRQLRQLTGRLDIGGGVFWMDPCMSSVLGVGYPRRHTQAPVTNETFWDSELSGNPPPCTDPNAIFALFQVPGVGAVGQLSHTPIFGPGQFLFDVSLMKRTRITERVGVDFRWEVFNLTNTTNFDIPDLNIFSTDFGQITNTVETQRVMQFALKINF